MIEYIWSFFSDKYIYLVYTRNKTHTCAFLHFYTHLYKWRQFFTVLVHRFNYKNFFSNLPHSTNEHSKHKLHHLANCYYCHRYDVVVSEFERCIGGRNYSSIGQKQKSENLRVFRKGCIFPGREEGKSIYGLPLLSPKLHLFSKSLGPQSLSHEPAFELTVYTSQSISRSWVPRLWKLQQKQRSPPSWVSWIHPPLPQPASQRLADLSLGSAVFNLPWVLKKAGSFSRLKDVACLSAFP